MTAAATRMSEAAAKFGKTVGDAATFAVGKIKTAKEDESEVSVRRGLYSAADGENILAKRLNS